MFKSEIQLTADGSHTLFIPELEEHYHSVNGAIQEAMHVYIEAALNQVQNPQLHVLELGFGTGLNAFLTVLEAEKRDQIIEYTGIEKYPLQESIYNELNYAEKYPSYARDIFHRLHNCDWEKTIPITPDFTLLKLNVDFTTFDFKGKYDVVYYDAFAPNKQSEVWSEDIFRKLYNCMNTNAVLTTYCAMGNVRRMMQHAGLEVERIPGPPGKREMLRGTKK